MTQDLPRFPFKHTLAFIAIAAFLLSFFGSRMFAIACPTCVVVQSGIHFHHFWYGIAMVALVGWLAIVWRMTERLDRAYALVYGLGLGLIGDEVGLLLTFGNYYSELTYQIFVGAIGLMLLGALAVRFWDRLKRDFSRVANWERFILAGLFLAGFSTIFLASDQDLIGGLFALLGVAGIVMGFQMRRKWTKVQTIRVEPGHPASA